MKPENVGKAMTKPSRFFKLIDPRFPDRGLAKNPDLSRLVAEAAIGFTFDQFPKSDDEANVVLSGAAIADFDEAVSVAESMLVQSGRYPSEAGLEPLESNHAGATLVDVFCDRFIAKEAAYQHRLASGRVIGQRQLLCAVAIWLVERTAVAIKAKDAVLVATLMRDLLEVVCEIRRALDREAGSTIAKRRARSRWAAMYEVRALAVKLFRAKSWTSTRAAATSIALRVRQFAESVGWRMSADRVELTIYEWLLKARKTT